LLRWTMKISSEERARESSISTITSQRKCVNKLEAISISEHVVCRLKIVRDVVASDLSINDDQTVSRIRSSIQSGMNPFTFSEEGSLTGNRSLSFQLRPQKPSISDQIYRTHPTLRFLGHRKLLPATHRVLSHLTSLHIPPVS
jgi:hypothetical protein